MEGGVRDNVYIAVVKCTCAGSVGDDFDWAGERARMRWSDVESGSTTKWEVGFAPMGLEAGPRWQRVSRSVAHATRRMAREYRETKTVRREKTRKGCDR